MNLAIIGAGGRVGLPFSILSAHAGHDVLGFDINATTVDMLNNGIMPFEEEGATPLLKKYTKTNMFNRTKLHFTTDSILDYTDKKFDMFIYILGTPVDSEGNPVLDDLIDEFHNLKEHLKNYSDEQRPTIVLRSTVAPGTTDTLNKILYGLSYDLFYIPERVLQGKSMTETVEHDWCIGTPPVSQCYQNTKLENFMDSLGIKNRHYLADWKSAEVGKLMTNMYRYLNFAFANEMYMLAADHNIDAHKMIDAFNSNYPRLSVPKPGPNVGGPCLFKDGKFLTAHIPYADLIDVSFQINEGMPEYIARKLPKETENVLILGGTFKANCDDTRNSLSFKLVKCLKRRGIFSYIEDPYFDYTEHCQQRGEEIKEPDKYDAVVIMTPHSVFTDDYVENILVTRTTKNAVFNDVWNSTKFGVDWKNT